MAFIYGFGLAAQWAGIENVWYNDNDHFCCEVVRARIKDSQIKDKVKIYEQDVREIGKHNLKRVDIISGGFPCQPFSQAGKRKGQADDRYLWPEMLRVIKELQPSYVIGENVAGLLSMENGETLKRILIDLEDAGYNNEIFIIPASATGAWHRRDRIWIIAYSESFSCNSKYQGKAQYETISEKRFNDTSIIANSNNTRKRTPRIGIEQDREKVEQNRDNTQSELSQHGKNVPNPNSCGHIHGKPKEQPTKRGSESQHKFTTSNKYEDISNTTSKRQRRQGEFKQSINSKKNNEWKAINVEQCSTSNIWSVEPNVGRVAHGIPERVDRLKALGNAIVPQIAYELFKAIKTNQ